METPASWLLLAGVQATLGWFFLDQLERYEQLAPRLAGLPSAPGITAMVGTTVLSAATVAMLAMTPLLAARAVAGERANGIRALLDSAPISSGAIARGKFMASLVVLWLVVLGAVALPASLAAGTEVDFGLLGACAVAMVLFAAMLAGLATLCASVTSQPLVAAALAFGVLLVSWVLGSAANTPALAPLAWLSPAVHLRDALRGVINSADIAWFVLVSGAELTIASAVIDTQRGTRGNR